MTIRLQLAAASALLCSIPAFAAPQPLEHFARRPQMHGVTISQDGQYVAFLSGAGDDTVLMTFDRTRPGSEFKRVTASEPGKFDLGWCRWANNKRLVCGLFGNLRGKKYAEPPFTRMFAVDADGAALKALEQSGEDANLFVARTSMRNLNMNQGAHIEKSTESEYAKSGEGENSDPLAGGKSLLSNAVEFQDEVIDFTPDDDEFVLIQHDDDRDTFSTIFQLNIYNGHRSVRLAENPPIQRFVTDGRGNPRIGWGATGNRETLYYARLDGERDWRRLGTMTERLRPIAMAAGENTAYAFGSYQGREALWSIDLADKREPRVLFNHALVDVGEPILQTDRRLLGVRYDVERPYVWYADPKLRQLVDRLESQMSGRYLQVIGISESRNTLLLQASSDVDQGTYYLFDIDKNRLQRLGTTYPELDTRTLGTMTNIVYKASDGTEIPGYLTIPTGAEKKNLPLIVMPHDGPVARDSWRFSFLRTFLANRGYAVLQMNYRGSAGFGEKWRLDAQRDWGGISYSDIHDATRWAVSEGIADPKRICMLGWGFGGYAALLGAVRNGDTYRCAVSIAGISDLEMHKEHAVIFADKEARRAQIGSDRETLERDSPLRHAAHIDIPVLLIHGTKDWQVQVDHTNAMAKALERNKKSPRTVIIKGGSHELERKSDRMTLLKEVEAFLAQQLAAVGGQANGR
jgi:dipeptidyl aminopeptidase/acylaminoacyl peptidase